MSLLTKTIPAKTKIYSTLNRCCTYAQKRPGAVQPIFKPYKIDNKYPLLGWAFLPERIDGVYIFWVGPL